METERGRERLPEQCPPGSLMSPLLHPAPAALPKDVLVLSQPGLSLATAVMWVSGRLTVSLTGRDACLVWQGTVTCAPHHTALPGTGLSGETGKTRD